MDTEKMLTNYMRLLYIANYYNWTCEDSEIQVVHQTENGDVILDRKFRNMVVMGPEAMLLTLTDNLGGVIVTETFEIRINENDSTLDIFGRVHKLVPGWKVTDDEFIAKQTGKVDNLTGYILGTLSETLTFKEKYDMAMEVVQNQAAIIKRLVEK